MQLEHAMSPTGGVTVAYWKFGRGFALQPEDLLPWQQLEA